MKSKLSLLGMTLLMLALPLASANASIIYFSTTLSAANETTPVVSAGTGTAFVTLDDVAKTLFVDLTFSGLTGPAAAGHIHCCSAPGVNASVRVPFVIPAATSGTYQHTFDLTTLLTSPTFTPADLIAGLLAGQAYVNLHTALYPGGEIRGQLKVSEPSILAMFGLGCLAFAMIRRRKA